ncbi:hypothetical protein GALMADRAFT_747331 [Galerina marginata CBS 339.88]|uniref:Uncharacterized protein n=1 Tax=Galerina marginata (strain CBS 339.88) TaxID=685588 RepID=A0A067T224_GALM3|nr:hypothetical protein GALMADRAFT_747331 [Galerina marginata CBS 339.88]
MGNEPFLPYCAPSRVLNTDLSDANALLAPPHPCTQDEQMIWFLGALWQYGYPQILKTHHASHLAELISRSTAYLLSKNRVIPAVNRNKYDPGLWHRNESAFPGTLEHSQFGQGIAKKVLDDSVTQFYLIFDSFMRQAAEVTKSTSLLGTVFNEPPFLKKFCSIPSRLLGDAIRHPAGLDLPEMFQQTLSFISSTLDHNVKQAEPHPLLFITACYILTDIFRDFQILDWNDKAGKIVTSFQKWNYDPVRSKPILSFMETLLHYFRRFPTMPGYYGAGDSAYHRAFTGGNIYVWHVTANFELSRLNIHTPIHPLDSPMKDVMEEKRVQAPIVGITASISSASSFPDLSGLSDSVSIRTDTDES